MPLGVDPIVIHAYNQPNKGSQLCVIGNRKWEYRLKNFTEVLINHLNCPWNALLGSDFMHIASQGFYYILSYSKSTYPVIQHYNTLQVGGLFRMRMAEPDGCQPLTFNRLWTVTLVHMTM